MIDFKRPGRPRRHRISALLALCTALLCLASVRRSEAQEKYGTPSAPLSSAHQGTTCAQCHLPQGDVPGQRCLACHPTVAQNIKRKIGLHGSDKAGMQCARCHTDHKGVDADIRGWQSVGGVEGFDHAITGFALTGQHAGRRCADCHNRLDASGTPRFPDASRSCAGASCHMEEHKPSLGRECRSCHEGATWEVKRFDHDHRTRFALVGKHQEMAEKKQCKPCHPGAALTWKPRPTLCSDATCHGRDDKHQGRNGDVCSNCHTATDWKSVSGFGQHDLNDLRSLIPMQDRWRIGYTGRLWDPYNQNVLKGDYAIDGKKTFLSLSLLSDTLFEARYLQTPQGASPTSPG